MKIVNIAGTFVGTLNIGGLRFVAYGKDRAEVIERCFYQYKTRQL